jgi:hypothetical protein
MLWEPSWLETKFHLGWRAEKFIIQLNSYLFTGKFNSPEANYKARTSKEQKTKQQIKWKQNTKEGNVYNNNNNNNNNFINANQIYN